MKQVIFHPVILASFENETVTDMVGTFRVLVVQLCFFILEYLNIESFDQRVLNRLLQTILRFYY